MRHIHHEVREVPTGNFHPIVAVALDRKGNEWQVCYTEEKAGFYVTRNGDVVWPNYRSALETTATLSGSIARMVRFMTDEGV